MYSRFEVIPPREPATSVRLTGMLIVTLAAFCPGAVVCSCSPASLHGSCSFRRCRKGQECVRSFTGGWFCALRCRAHHQCPKGLVCVFRPPHDGLADACDEPGSCRTRLECQPGLVCDKKKGRCVRPVGSGPAVVPVARLEGNQVLFSPPIRFEVGKAKLRVESEVVLWRILIEIWKRPEERQIRVEYHPGCLGARGHVSRLGLERAESIRRWMIRYRVKPGRIVARVVDPYGSASTHAPCKASKRRVRIHVTGPPSP